MGRVEIRRRAEALAERLREHGIAATVRDDEAGAGGGSLPDLPLPTAVLAITPDKISDAQFAERLRLGNPAVVARTQERQALFDLRTVLPGQEDDLLRAIVAALKVESPQKERP